MSLPSLTNPFSAVFDEFFDLRKCFPKETVQFKFNRVFTDLNDGATLHLDGCLAGSRVIMRQAIFKRGSNCFQDLSAGLRCPQTLVGPGEQGDEDGQVKLTFEKCVLSCSLASVGQCLDQACRDEDLLEDAIDLQAGGTSPEDLPPFKLASRRFHFPRLFD